ncbi:MAG TPA: GGDEF domain-containing protein [Thermoleophilaceae bacterium]|nr:GGDEF domain-containing protein [Thermoleophilaceae bacterium]
MNELDEITRPPIMGRLARLGRDRDVLAKAWLVRLIERSSLDEIASLPTDRIAAELPLVIADVLTAAASERPSELPEGAAERVAGLAELRNGTPASITRDLGAVQLVVLDALRDEAADLGAEELADIAAGLAEAVGAVQAAGVKSLAGGQAGEHASRATIDSLTGLFNLAHLHDTLSHALALHKRYGHRFSLLVLDVNGLARVNDARGRSAGDRVLVQTALAVRRTIRSVDTAARIGGDEVCVLAPDQGGADMTNLARRLVEAVRTETALPDEPGMEVAVGVVACPEHGDDVEYLLAAADQAMYRAKAAGEPFAMAEPAPEIRVERAR